MSAKNEDPKFKSKPGRPRKTDTIVKRTINVYLPDMIMANEWKRVAKEHNLSVSKFIIERVEQSLNDAGEGPRYSRSEVLQENQRLDAENRILKQELEIRNKAYEILEKQLERLHMQPFLTPGFEGERQLSDKLVDAFKERKHITFDEILPIMGYRPTDVDAVKALNAQIQALVGYGLLRSDLRGWWWNG